MKGLTCSIFEPKNSGNCSNNGISARCSSVILLGVQYLSGRFKPAGEIFEPTETCPAVIIEERDVMGRMYYTAYPCNEKAEKLPGWWMAGGCYIKTSDSRFPFDYPIPLHDRQED